MIASLRVAFSLLPLLPLIIANPIANPEAVALAEPIAVPPPCIQLKDGDQTREVHFHRQLTSKLDCSTAANCATTHLEHNTFGWSVEAGGNTPFNSVGLFVTNEYTTGNEYQCGGITRDVVCVWVKVKYLEYHIIQTGTCDSQDGKKTIRAPMSGQGDGDFYCVNGNACRTEGEGYWEEDQ